MVCWAGSTPWSRWPCNSSSWPSSSVSCLMGTTSISHSLAQDCRGAGRREMRGWQSSHHGRHWPLHVPRPLPFAWPSAAAGRTL
jgi:hypothetical protein